MCYRMLSSSLPVVLLLCEAFLGHRVGVFLLMTRTNLRTKSTTCSKEKQSSQIPASLPPPSGKGLLRSIRMGPTASSHSLSPTDPLPKVGRSLGLCEPFQTNTSSWRQELKKTREACTKGRPSRPLAGYWVGLVLEGLTVSQVKEIFLCVCHLNWYFQVWRERNDLTHGLFEVKSIFFPLHF